MYLPSYGKGGAATTQHWTELAEHFALQNKVHVRTAAGGALAGREFIHGVEVHRLGGAALRLARNRHLREVLLWFAFLRDGFRLRDRYDCVICVDTPRFAPLFCLARRLVHKSKVIMWIMDLPLEQVERRSAGGLFLKGIKILNTLSYNFLGICNQVVVMGSCMGRVLVSRGIDKVGVIGPWPVEPLSPASTNTFSTGLLAGIKAKFVVAYTGHAGLWHEFDVIIQVIKEISGKYPIHFVFCGCGAGIERMRNDKDLCLLGNVTILGWLPDEDFAELSRRSQVRLVSLKKTMLGTCVPSKTYSAFSYGRPVLFLGPRESQVAVDILNARAGIVAENKDQFIQALEKFYLEADFLDQCAENAEQAFLSQHNAARGFQKWDELLESMLKGQKLKKC